MNEKCEMWLKNRLAGKGKVPINEVRGEAMICGFTRKELKEARRTLGVKLTTVNDEYHWYLEDD